MVQNTFRLVNLGSMWQAFSSFKVIFSLLVSMVSGIEEELANWLAEKKKVVVAGIGNPIRTDDYVGLNIVEKLKGKLPETVFCLKLRQCRKATC